MLDEIIRTWDSPQAFWDQMAKPPVATHAKSITSSFEYQDVKTRTYDEAMELARNGWAEGLEKIRPMAARLAAKLGRCIGQPEPVHAVVGETPDVGAFLAGEPEDMIAVEPREESRIVRIVYNVVASCNVGGDNLIKRGAVACALVDAVEQSGIRAEVIAVFRSGNSLQWQGEVVIKRADEPLNLDRVAFALAHPSFMRRLMFRGMEQEPSQTNRERMGIGRNYGKPEDIEPKRRGDIYFPAMLGWERQWDTPESSEAAALAMLKKAGVEIHQD